MAAGESGSTARQKEEDRFDRQRRINWWSQSKLAEARVLVVGSGALGNEILKNLLLLGVGNIAVVDNDRVENSNLSRAVLFREADNGQFKAEVAARNGKLIYPGARVHAICAKVPYEIGQGIFRWADIIISGVDNREARLAINKAAWGAGIPWVDGATEEFMGLARVFVPPDGPCYECTMSPADWEEVNRRRACNLLSREEMLEGHVPTTATTASVVAAVQTQEAVKWLHGVDVLAGKGFVFNGLTHDSYVVEYQRKQDCCTHDETWRDLVELPCGVADLTARQMLQRAREELGADAVVEFSYDIASRLTCPACGTSEQVFAPLESLRETSGKCPSCGSMRAPEIFHSIDGGEDFLDRTFSELGLPPFEIISARSGMRRRYYEFSADRAMVLTDVWQAASFARRS